MLQNATFYEFMETSSVFLLLACSGDPRLRSHEQIGIYKRVAI